MSTAMERIHCRNCDKRCYGEALRVQDFHFHPTCFVCKACNIQLAHQGFYMHEDDFFCSKDYLAKFGTRCHTCGDFVEGDVISALGNTYHQHCFVCAQCRQPFPPGEQVTQEGDDCFCEKCLSVRDAETAARLCPTCQEFVEVGQGLLALDRIWHVWCFRCKECGKDLSAKYIVMDDQTYCEDDFNRLHGVRCELCQEYIAGKVVQAGDSFFHANCSQCAVCGKHVHEDVDVFVLGSNIWHSECFSQSGSENTAQNRKNVQDETEKPVIPEIVTSLPDATPSQDTEAAPSLEETVRKKVLSPSSSASGDSAAESVGDSAISCSTPTCLSSEAETPGAAEPPSESGSSSSLTSSSTVQTTSQASEAESHLGTGNLSSRPSSETSAASASTAVGPSDLDSCPSTPTPTPGVIQRTPSTSSSGSGGRVRPRSIAGVPMRSLSGSQSLSSSASSFNWKEMYSVDDSEEDRMPLPKSAAGIKSLAHGVVSPSTSADRFPRRDSKPSHLSTSLRDKSVSPTSPTAGTPLSLIEETESSVPAQQQQSPPPTLQPQHQPGETIKPQSSSPVSTEKRMYPLIELQLTESDTLLPKGVDRTRLEEYLTDEDFEEALGMTRDAFYKKQLWRQRELKRKAKLF